MYDAGDVPNRGALTIYLPTHTGTRNSYFNTLDFMKENVEFFYRIYTANAHILFLSQLGF
jgi:hypothetical protein